MKQVLSALLLLAFCCQVFNRAAIVTSYYANTAAYEKNCENKARPKLACHGKCQMMKKLKADEKKDQQNPERRSDNKNEIVLSSKSFYPSVRAVSSLTAGFSDAHRPDAESCMPRFVFHPPSA